MRRALRRAVNGWERFLFEPQPTSTLAVFRIAFGLIVTLWTASQGPHLFTFYGPEGILPTPPTGPAGTWGLLSVLTGAFALVVVWLVTLAGAVALTVGWHSRLAAVVVFVGILAFERRNPMVLNAGDILLRNIAFLVMLAPTGAALSVDRWRTDRAGFWTFPPRAPWALRLIQIQLCIVYLSAFWAKVQGDLWRGGTAVTWANRIADIHRFPTPEFLGQSVVLTELMTFATLAIELALPILVWNRTARPWILALGIGMHLGIELFIMVGFFSATIVCVYLTFIPPATASRFVWGVRDRVRGWRRPGTRPPVQPEDPGLRAPASPQQPDTEVEVDVDAGAGPSRPTPTPTPNDDARSSTT